jgi:hypothetical protein
VTVRVSIAEGTIPISPAKARSFGPDDESAVGPLLMPACVFRVMPRDAAAGLPRSLVGPVEPEVTPGPVDLDPRLRLPMLIVIMWNEEYVGLVRKCDRNGYLR